MVLRGLCIGGCGYQGWADRIDEGHLALDARGKPPVIRKATGTV